jgi:hypothetical protein
LNLITPFLAARWLKEQGLVKLESIFATMWFDGKYRLNLERPCNLWPISESFEEYGEWYFHLNWTLEERLERPARKLEQRKFEDILLSAVQLRLRPIGLRRLQAL